MDRPRSRSRARRRPPLPPLRINPPVAAKSKGVPQLMRYESEHQQTHHPGRPPPAKKENPPPRYMPARPKFITHFAQRTTPLRPRSQLTNNLLRPRSAPTPKLPPTPLSSFAKAEAHAHQGNDWGDFSPYVPQDNSRLPDYLSAFNPDGSPEWLNRYPRREIGINDLELPVIK